VRARRRPRDQWLRLPARDGQADDHRDLPLAASGVAPAALVSLTRRR
jgi:hypothetical protein